jgi:peroxidase
VVVNFDDATPSTFDNAYYKTLLCNRGVLSSDQRLSTHPHTQTLVSSYARSSSLFSRNFAAAIQKLGTLGVLTGTEGEIRQDCSLVNSLKSIASPLEH